MAPPTPQRTPTGRSLSSTAFPCASFVLRPSDCHLEVAPTTTATCLFPGFALRFAVMQRSLCLVHWKAHRTHVVPCPSWYDNAPRGRVVPDTAFESAWAGADILVPATVLRTHG